MLEHKNEKKKQNNEHYNHLIKEPKDLTLRHHNRNKLNNLFKTRRDRKKLKKKLKKNQETYHKEMHETNR
jgi:hypothetical protein